MKEAYWRGDVGYVSGEVLNGGRPSPNDDANWTIARYVLIPWNLLENSLAEPYVFVDATGSAARVQTPEGFTRIYDSTTGVILLKRVSSR
jgi:hypothetical protein